MGRENELRRVAAPSRLFSLALCAWFLGAALLAGGARAVPDVNFPDGVASGDVTSDSAVVWTRVDRATPVRVEVATRPDFRGSEVFRQNFHPSADDDLIVKAVVAPLEPDTTYYYRWRHGSAISEVGSFRTAPAKDTSAAVRFAYTADSDFLFQQYAGNDFEVLDAIRAENPDFWIYLGDTIYSDSGLRPGGPAETLEEYRDMYRMTRAIPALPDLMASTSTYAVWDDHEVYNDFSGQSVDPARYAIGRQAFIEYMPTMDAMLLEDPSCAGNPLFRVFHWGKDIDLFVLDERSCRSANVAEGTVCEVLPGVDDIIPTMPPLIRALLATQIPGGGALIPVSPPPGCVAAIFDPSRTMLGPVQKAAFKDALLASTAKFKFIVNEVPIQQFWALPYDRWEGYGAERNEILSFIRDNVSGVIFLTTDMHANVINDAAIDAFLAPAPIAPEFVTGPIATNTFEAEILDFAAGAGLPGPVIVGAFHQLLGVSGASCRNLDIDAYALVEVTPGPTGTATISIRDSDGAAVTNSDPFHPGNQNACTRTVP